MCSRLSTGEAGQGQTGHRARQLSVGEGRGTGTARLGAHHQLRGSQLFFTFFRLGRPKLTASLGAKRGRKFEGKADWERKGSQGDVDHLEQLLQQLGYQVTSPSKSKDLTKQVSPTKHTHTPGRC